MAVVVVVWCGGDVVVVCGGDVVVVWCGGVVVVVVGWKHVLPVRTQLRFGCEE